MLIVGILAILGLGYYLKEKPPKSEPTQAPPISTPPTSQEPPKTDPPKVEPPKSEPAPTSTEAILAERTRINRANGAASTMTVTVYYADGLKNGESLQPVQMMVPASQALIRTIVEQILDAPEQLQLYSSVPPGTKIGPAGVNLDSETGVATVDLTPEIEQVQGSASTFTVMASFVYSLTELPSVKAVQLWANGRPVTIHGVDWNRPLSRADLEGRNLFKVEPVMKYEAKP